MAKNWQNRLILLVLLIPLIPAVLVALWFMGAIGTSPYLEPGDPGGMNPVAAIGWGAGVYCFGLMLIGMGFFAVQAVTR
jgi:hypothetical protein